VSAVFQDSIIFDPGVDAAVTLRNPYLNPLPTDPPLPDDGGAYVGDPNYTRIGQVVAEVQAGSDECSDLVRVASGATTRTLTPPLAPGEQAVLSLPLAVGDTPGSVTVPLTVSDGAENTADYSTELFYDNQPPQFGADPGTLAVVGPAGQPISSTDRFLVDLRFEQVQASDAGYGERETLPFWGVQLATSPAPAIPITDTARLDALNWQTVAVADVTTSDGRSSFTVENWSLLPGPASDPRGSELVTYARLVDGAGNVSLQALRAPGVTLASDTVIERSYLPLLAR
jgi:hypothetical protein